MVASGPSSNYDEADFNHGLLGRSYLVFLFARVKSWVVSTTARVASQKNKHQTKAPTAIMFSGITVLNVRQDDLTGVENRLLSE